MAKWSDQCGQNPVSDNQEVLPDVFLGPVTERSYLLV